MGSSAIPCLRYRDAAAAITWLCEAFGFREHLVVPDGAGGIAHAQLVRESANGVTAMVMLGSARDDELGRLCRLPSEAGGVTQSPYLIVEPIDAHYEQAKAAGAEIVMPNRDQDYGGRGYSCRDLEGNLWNFGSYDPWAAEHSRGD